jgi:metal-responsive CopG/Arc/MetJ family transcriptional regulator
MSTNQKIVGISFPREVLEKLDKVREDVPRSKYIVRLLEKRFNFESEYQK